MLVGTDNGEGRIERGGLGLTVVCAIVYTVMGCMDDVGSDIGSLVVGSMNHLIGGAVRGRRIRKKGGRTVLEKQRKGVVRWTGGGKEREGVSYLRRIRGFIYKPKKEKKSRVRGSSCGIDRRGDKRGEKGK